MREILLVGADIEIVELVRADPELDLVAIVDPNVGPDYHGIEVIASDRTVLEDPRRLAAAVTITLDDPGLKERLHREYEEAGFSFQRLISDQASVSPLATIAEGSIVQRGVNVGPGVKIGRGVKLNVNVNVMHDCAIGAFSSLGPNAVLTGYVSVGHEAFIGANATILPRVAIADRVTVGAGSVVTRDLEAGDVYYGNPARRARQ